MSSAPAESSRQLIAEHAWLAGALATGTGYGVVMALFWFCSRALWVRLKHEDTTRKRNITFLVYVSIMFVLGSLFITSNSIFTQLAFVNNRGYPGGPSAFEEEMFSIGVDEIGNASYVIANWLSDSMLVWRCVIIYRDFGALSGRVVLAITAPMQLASYVLGIFFLLQISSPSSSPYNNAGQSINWTFPYFCLSLALNIFVTFLIVIRLLLYRRTMVRLLGPGHASECTTVVAVLIESAAVYSTFSLLFLIPFALANSVSYTFIQVIGEAQLIAPLLIIYREAQGKGWLSSASTVGSSTSHGEGSAHIRRFTTDIQFASDASYAESHDSQVFELTTKKSSSGDVGVDLIIEEVRRDVREEIELC